MAAIATSAAETKRTLAHPGNRRPPPPNRQRHQGRKTEPHHNAKSDRRRLFVAFNRRLRYAGNAVHGVLGRFAGEIDGHRGQRDEDEDTQCGLFDFVAGAPKAEEQQAQSKNRPQHRKMIQNEVDVGKVHGTGREFGTRVPPNPTMGPGDFLWGVDLHRPVSGNRMRRTGRSHARLRGNRSSGPG